MQYALCPSCSSTLQVSQEQVDAKNGLVRCGHCNEIFDAIKHQLKTPDNVRALELPQEDPFIAPATPEIEEQLTEEKIDESTQLENPAWETKKPIQQNKIPFGLLSFIALIILIFQLVSNYPNHFTQNTNLQPAFEKLNRAFDLNIPRYKDTNELRVLDRQLSNHPTRSNTLQLKLTIKNTAPVNQDYPIIHLTLSTAIGQNNAQVTFRKIDYLKNTDMYDPFKPYSTKQIILYLSKPKDPVSGFEISFGF
jgi:predicted Zn finger-like uncharacterized protein